jgi:hypothetical protein
MASNKRERSAGEDMSYEDLTHRKHTHPTSAMDKFSVQVTLRSNSKAQRNDHKPVKTWKQYCEELGRARREAGAREATPPDILPTEEK